MENYKDQKCRACGTRTEAADEPKDVLCPSCLDALGAEMITKNLTGKSYVDNRFVYDWITGQRPDKADWCICCGGSIFQMAGIQQTDPMQADDAPDRDVYTCHRCIIEYTPAECGFPLEWDKLQMVVFLEYIDELADGGGR